MYSIQSLVEFLDKRRNQLTGDQISQIISRAESFSESDEFHEWAVNMILEDENLAKAFVKEAAKSVDTDALLQIEFGSSSMGML